MTQKAGYLLRNEGMGGIRLSKSSVQMLDIVALLLRMRRVNSALTLIFRKKSNLINGKSSLGDGWSNVPSPGSTIPDVSAKIMRFPSLLLRLWLKSPISIPYSSAYEYSFKDLYAKRRETIERVFADAKEKHGVRYTLYRGLAQVSKWVRLKFAAMNLKKLARWKAKRLSTHSFLLFAAFMYLLCFAACQNFFLAGRFSTS